MQEGDGGLLAHVQKCIHKLSRSFFQSATLHVANSNHFTISVFKQKNILLGGIQDRFKFQGTIDL